MFSTLQDDLSPPSSARSTDAPALPEPGGASLPLRAPTALRPSALVDIARGLARTADVWRGRLPADSRQRTGFRLIATPEYDVWLLHWPPGTSVAPHDHGQSAGVFAVAAGELYEIRWHGEMPCRRRVARGESVTVPRGVVHDVLAGDGPALSVHVYSPPLTSMSYYDGDGGRGRVDRQVVEGGAIMIEPRALHPSAGR